MINVELGRQLFKSISKKIRQSEDFKRALEKSKGKYVSEEKNK